MSATASRIAELLPNTTLVAASREDTPGLGGLRCFDGRAFPLKRVVVRASLAGPCARTIVEQKFGNPFNETLDVTWIFPLPADSAIVELELVAGDIRVVGECQERQQAQATFNAARQAGKRAALAEKEAGNVHTLSLAGLPAHSEVTIRFTLVQLLPSIDGRFRWQFPTTIAPRYTPGDAIGHAGYGTQSDTTVVPNASRLSPPLQLQGGAELDLEVEIAGPVSALESSLHALKLSMDDGGVRIAPAGHALLNKDFILEFSTADRREAVTRAWSDGVHTLVLVEPTTVADTGTLPRDAVFVVDISGSMQGSKMDAAKLALSGALHGLRLGDRFKLLAFDDRVERFSDDFVLYDDRNLVSADRWIGRLDARDGTEMLAAIQESLDGATPAGRLRTVLLITDGQSNDETRLLPAVANRRGEAVFFTLGIDTSVNETLLKSLARAGGGVCELCTPSDNIDAVVARLENRFGNPLLSHLKTSGAARPDGQTVFAGRPASMLLEGSPNTVSVTATSSGGAFEQTVVPARISFALGALWGMERVAYLEERLTLRPFEEEAIRPEILRVALQWHIASKFTSFVCVDHSTVSSGERRHVVQPTELPEAWVLPEEMSAPMAMPSPMPAMTQQKSFRPTMSYPSAASRQTSRMPMPPAPSPLPDGAVDEQTAFYSPAQPRPVSPSASAPDAAPGSGGAFSAGIGSALRGMFGAGSAAAPSQADHTIPAGYPFKNRREGDASALARSQGADGSYGGDVGRTAAALLALLLLGNTRLAGDRRRTVQKAATWLAGHTTDSRASLALTALESAEIDGVKASTSWRTLSDEGLEGVMLAYLLDEARV